ncbi:MAG: hypothetical protein HQ498_05360 [Pseudohongiella sp.]|nr:hypothetical protein [Pseudohongiella sp.]
MKLNTINEWLTLIANVGVLIGIIVVAVELQQTQIAMQGEASTVRAEMSQQITREALEFGVIESTNKIGNGEELSQIEREEVRTFFLGLLRFLENQHYQNQIGILDKEQWESNRRTIENMCIGNNIPYSYIYPNGVFNASFRESFLELLNPPCGE